MAKAICSLIGLAALSLSACGGESPDSGETGSLDRDQVTDVALQRQLPTGPVNLKQNGSAISLQQAHGQFDNILAALATAVLKCKGSLAANDFVVGEKGLTPAFDHCSRDQSQFEKIRLMLGVQLYDKSAARYFVSEWQDHQYRTRNLECPIWDPVEEIHSPTEENVKRYTDATLQRQLPSRSDTLSQVAGAISSETYNRWQIQPTEQCKGDQACSVDSAVACSSWASKKFIVSTNTNGELVTDPEWWWDNGIYHPNPFDPTYGYEHPMAESGYVPGDIYGAVNRAGEQCSRYIDNVNIMHGRMLRAIDCDGLGWYCVSMCMFN